MSGIFNIAYAINDGFVNPTCVSIFSLLKNNKKYNIYINIIYSSLSEENIRKIRMMENFFSNVKFHFHKIEEDRFLRLKLPVKHITVETYFRYILPEILPSLNSVLYLDGDTIINGDISKLFVEDISGYYCAGVPDFMNMNVEYKKSLGINSFYINAGVILYNLSEIRKSNIVDLLFSISHERDFKFCDQDVINIVFDGKIKELDIVYNFKHIHQKIFSKKFKDAKIVHYIGTNKPWKKFSFSAWRWLWYKYFILLLFQSFMIKKRKYNKINM
ncbi:glycosyltransferase family 8 protein [Intestinicryptomonas porci]|uniref:Glycosyltransferase family 8 protein n=1 Tax=Intestinicryptomonas porci TaxID=2926320 RepID=A0ABU4WGY9_9BACT|nr:glycosyltransferase family 8 protein [Opitutales bacterium CLA-KB-P66]